MQQNSCNVNEALIAAIMQQLQRPATSSALQLIGFFSYLLQQCTALVSGRSRIAVM